MFAVLNRHRFSPFKQNSTSISGSEKQPPLRNVGASMKFQYGNGDKPLDGYIIKRGVGTGGFGDVYFAESESGKEVALKRIQKNLEVEIRGVRHCLNLRHPNLVSIYDIRVDADEQGWIVMEYIAGESLRDHIDRNANSIEVHETLCIFSQVVAGVAYLHDQGIVHRDLKPANVFIDNGLVKIGDYGLSKFISTSRRGGQTESVGTFHYMAPEIGRGEYGKEIDVYSLGVILYEMLTGVVPFDGESSQEIILKHLTAEPDVSMLPRPYAEAIRKCMEKDPTSRFRDCRELLEAIGWQLDRTGMATGAKQEPSNNSIPQRLQPLSSARPSAKSFGLGNDHTTIAGQKLGADGVSGGPIPIARWVDTPRNFQGGAAAALSHTSLYQEPVARAIHQALMEAQVWLRSLPTPLRAISIVFLVILLISNGSWIAPIGFLALIAYVAYYVVWYLAGGPAKAIRSLQPSAQMISVGMRSPRGALVQPGVHNPLPIPYKAALRSWQKEQREDLASRGIWSQLYARTRSWSFSGMTIGVLALASGLLVHARAEGDSTVWIGGIVWTAIMSLLMSWTIIFFARRWESQTEDSIVYRFVLMSAGVMLGLISYSLSEHLQIPWQSITSTDFGNVVIRSPDWNRAWKGFYGEGGDPLLPAHIAYFASLMWIVRWWRQADSLRKSRFSIISIGWCIAMAALVQGLFAFPMPWCLILAASVSFAVQLASPWLSFEEARSELKVGNVL